MALHFIPNKDNISYAIGNSIHIPVYLFTDPAFSSLSSNAKILYGMMLKRTEMSSSNNWIDDDGTPYICYPFIQICGDLNCAKATCSNILTELEDAGLIVRMKKYREFSKIYVQIPIYEDITSSSGGADTEPKEDNTPSFLDCCRTNIGVDAAMASENISYRSWFNRCFQVIEDVAVNSSGLVWIGGRQIPVSVVKERFLRLRKAHLDTLVSSLAKISSKINNLAAYIRTALYNAVSVTLDGSSDGEPYSVQKMNTDIDIDKDLKKDIYLINQSISTTSQTDSEDQMDTIQEVFTEVADNVDLFAVACDHDHNNSYVQRYGELVDLITETICSDVREVRINGRYVPTHTVKERFRSLRRNHLMYVLGCLDETNTKISNIRSYLLTALYNAPVTINNYYQQHINYSFGS